MTIMITNNNMFIIHTVASIILALCMHAFLQHAGSPVPGPASTVLLIYRRSSKHLPCGSSLTTSSPIVIEHDSFYLSNLS